MDEFLTALYEEFVKVCPESHLEVNQKNEIVYPYLTYAFDREALEEGVDGFYIDVDLFDRSKNLSRLLNLEEDLKRHFLKRRQMTESIYIRFNFLRSTKVPTQDENLRRRNLQIYCKTDWRIING